MAQDKIVPEQYDEYGRIIPTLPAPIIYERKLTSHQQHRIHETKDLFEANCSYCQTAMKKRTSFWESGA